MVNKRATKGGRKKNLLLPLLLENSWCTLDAATTTLPPPPRWKLIAVEKPLVSYLAARGDLRKGSKVSGHEHPDEP